jgi:hypothetical protein
MSERIEKMRVAVKVMHRCDAVHAGSVPVREMSGQLVAWEGVVEVFNLAGHPGALRCYAWSYPDGTEQHFVTVLEIPPVKDAQTAVRASIKAARKPGAV